MCILDLYCISKSISQYPPQPPKDTSVSVLLFCGTDAANLSVFIWHPKVILSCPTSVSLLGTKALIIFFRCINLGDTEVPMYDNLMCYNREMWMSQYSFWPPLCPSTETEKGKGNMT